VAKKLYYKIGEACKVLEIQPYVLRYWEKEFPFLSPDKNKSGQRVYSQQELDTIRRIKELLYEEGYTIAGAKKKLEAETAAGESPADGASGPPPAQGKAASEVDTGTADELQRLRSGVEAALGQARGLLRMLSSSSAGAAEHRSSEHRSSEH
jgi:DNA-binding transcriptional MerR regulator